jgi:hypothetical protein
VIIRHRPDEPITITFCMAADAVFPDLLTHDLGRRRMTVLHDHGECGRFSAGRPTSVEPDRRDGSGVDGQL